MYKRTPYGLPPTSSDWFKLDRDDAPKYFHEIWIDGAVVDNMEMTKEMGKKENDEGNIHEER